AALSQAWRPGRLCDRRSRRLGGDRTQDIDVGSRCWRYLAAAPESPLMRARMASALPSPMPAAALPPAGVRLPASGLTDVEMTWIEGGLEQQLRFGRVAAERSGGPHKRIASFRPDATFGLIGCTAGDLGCVFWSLAIVRAVAPGAPYATHPAVQPGGEIL